MRILVVHCKYRQRGGEDAVFEAETSQLKTAGHEVAEFVAKNSELDTNGVFGKLSAAATTVWGGTQLVQLKSDVQRFRPDVVHFHNTFPSLSPRAYSVCNDENVPVVQTLHNYRLLCANAMFLRKGIVCEACIGGRFLNGVVHACYRGSRSASAAVASMQYVHWLLGTFANRVHRFVALTEFAKRKFIAGGIPAEKLVVKPNSLSVDPGVGVGKGGYILFLGRLSPEKGVHTLLEAWKGLGGVQLKIAGDGPLLDDIRRRATSLGPEVEVMGSVSPATAVDLMRDASLLVVPSEWYEGFPMTIVEAYACGTPVIAANIGSLSSIVVDNVTGKLFPVGEPDSLAAAIRYALNETRRLVKWRESARRKFVDSYSASRNVEALEEIYRGVQGVYR